jgi:dCMP deaminase
MLLLFGMKKYQIKFIEEVLESARQMSKDPKTKVSAIIVGKDFRQFSIGVNGQPRGVSEIWDDDLKHELVLHAEDNAILNCPFPVEGCTMFVSHQPCHRCIARLIQVGIKQVVWVLPYTGKATCSEITQHLLSSDKIEITTMNSFKSKIGAL